MPRKAPLRDPEALKAPRPVGRAGQRWARPASGRGSTARGVMWAMALSALFWGVVGLLACALPGQEWAAISAATKLL